MTTVTALNVRGGITESSFTDLTSVPVTSITPGQSITVTFDGALTEAEACAVVRRIETADADMEAVRAAVETAPALSPSMTDTERMDALQARLTNLTRLVLGR